MVRHERVGWNIWVIKGCSGPLAQTPEGGKYHFRGLARRVSQRYIDSPWLDDRRLALRP